MRISVNFSYNLIVLIICILVRVKNKWTFEQTLFNPIRSKRPMNNNFEQKTAQEVSDEFELIPEKCDFCAPVSYTAIGNDVFTLCCLFFVSNIYDYCLTFVGPYFAGPLYVTKISQSNL